MTKEKIDFAQKVAAIDFDGVIKMVEEWKGKETTEEQPVDIEQMKYELFRLKDNGWKIIVWSARSEIRLIHNWLDKHNLLIFDGINTNRWAPDNLFAARKIPANVYVDDRGITFNGNWEGMADKIMNFKQWDKPKKEIKMDSKPESKQNPNQTKRTIINDMPGILPANILGYHPDQIAFFVPDAEAAMEKWIGIGHKEWIKDEVFAIQTRAPWLNDRMNLESFKVKLCFNYSIFPCEFELISVISGSTVQIPNRPGESGLFRTGLSHMGIHVDDISIAIKDFEKSGFKVMADITTYRHRNCDHMYHYVFIDTQELGFITKLIKRTR